MCAKGEHLSWSGLVCARVKVRVKLRLCAKGPGLGLRLVGHSVKVSVGTWLCVTMNARCILRLRTVRIGCSGSD